MKFLKWFQTRRMILRCLLIAAASLTCYAQSPPTSTDRENAREMLDSIKSDLEKNYYDPNFRGMNVDERFKAATEKTKQAESLAQLLGIVGQVLLDLDDSHTFFLPPGRTYRTDYGWHMKTIGARVYVSAIKPGSDAEAKGLKEGDEVVSVDGLKPTRENLWKILYLYHAIRPRPGMRLIVKRPDGAQQQLDVAAKIREGKKVVDLTAANQGYDSSELIRDQERLAHLYRQRYVDLGDVFIWKMPSFDMNKTQTKDFAGKFRNRKVLILDLRGNGGGYEEMLLALIGSVFDREVKVGDLKRRKEQKPMIAKSSGDDAFAGKILVLIDSESGSASELFARVLQLEKRGTVIGDRSAGAVMRSRTYSHTIGLDRAIPFGVSITDADIIMTDGQSLEHTGVIPDEIKLPSASDMAAKRDPVLVYALSLVGIDMSPEKAGALFPIEWVR